MGLRANYLVIVFLCLVLPKILSSVPQNITTCTDFKSWHNNNVFVLLFNITARFQYDCLRLSYLANITLKGNGNTIGCHDDCPSAIDVQYSNNITIMDFIIEGFYFPIRVIDASHVKIVNNTIRGFGNSTTIHGITIAVTLEDSTDFLVEGNRMYKLTPPTPQQIPRFIFGLYVKGQLTKNGLVVNNTISDLYSECGNSALIYGLQIQDCYNCIVEGNIVTNIYTPPKDCTNRTENIYGIVSQNTSDTRLIHNNVNRIIGAGWNTQGIVLRDSYVVLEYNNISDIQGLFEADSVFGVYIFQSNCVLRFTTISNLYSAEGAVPVAIRTITGHNITFTHGTIANITSGYAFSLGSGTLYVADSTIDAESYPATAWCFSTSESVVVGQQPCEEFIFGAGENFTCRPAQKDCEVTSYYFYNGSCPEVTFAECGSLCTDGDLAGYCDGKSSVCMSNNYAQLACSCSNGICDAGEDCSTCYMDCSKDPSCSVPGDMICGPTENCTTSFSDCNCTVEHACGGTPPCSGNGACVEGLCVCYGNWSDVYCSTKTLNITVIPSTVGPSVSIIPAGVVNIYVSGIAEINSTNGKERKWNFTMLNFTVTMEKAPGVVSWIFARTMFDNGLGEVIVNISYFNQYSTFTFANQTISVTPQTVKFSIHVRSWPFLSVGNSLLFELKVEGDFARDGENNFLTEQQEIGGNLVWKKMLLDYCNLYSRFYEFALLDNRPQTVQFASVPNSTDIHIKIQHFWEFVEVDPHFSFLALENSLPPDPLGQGDVLSVTIIVIVCVCGAVVVLSGFGVHHYIMKRRVRKAVEIQMNILDEKIRILFAESNPPGTMPTFANMALREFQAIVPSHYAPAVTWKTLQEKIDQVKPTLLHIWAHGDRDGDDFGIILSDNDSLPLEVQRHLEHFRVLPQQLAQLITDAHIECVIFSVCHSAVFVEETYSHAHCNCVGFDGLVNPRYMARWCEGFYQGLIDSKSFHECVEEGFSHLRNNPIRNNEIDEVNDYNIFKDAMVVRPPAEMSVAVAEEADLLIEEDPATLPHAPPPPSLVLYSFASLSSSPE